MSPVLPFVISIVVGLVLAVITARLDNKERALAGLVGFTAVCLGTLISIYIEMGHLKEDVQNDLEKTVPILKSEVWSAVVNDIADYDRHEPDNKFSAVLEDPVRKNIEGAFTQATNGRIDVEDQADVVRITSELMDQASDSILATSYIDPKDWWGPGIGDNYFNKIEGTKKHVPHFNRVFIVGSTEEARLLEPILLRQRAIGLDIQYVCAVNIKSTLRRDFIVIDGEVGADLTLDNERHFQRATFYSTHQEAENLKRAFQDLMVYAKPFDPQKAIHCP
jgi:hypothetical protein